jgi:hypothetical protein
VEVSPVEEDAFHGGQPAEFLRHKSKKATVPYFLTLI